MTRDEKARKAWGRKMARARARKAAARRRQKEAETKAFYSRLGLDPTPLEARFRSQPPFGGLGLDAFIVTKVQALAPEYAPKEAAAK